MLAKLQSIVLKLLPIPKPVNETGTLVIYRYLDTLCHAIETIRRKPEFADYEVFSPTSYHEIEHACGYTYSPVRWFTLVMALTGTMAGFLMCMLCDLDWPLVVGGKTPALYSMPAYVVICFETTILFGGIGTIAGMLVFCKLPNPKLKVLDKRLTDDRFAIYVPKVSTQSEEVKLLQQLGGEEVKAID